MRRAWDPWLCRISGTIRRRASGRLARGSQAHQEFGQGGHFSGVQLLAVGRHVASARGPVADLIDELVTRQPRADCCQVRSALTADALKGVAVPAVLVLEHKGPLQLERGTPAEQQRLEWGRRSRRSSGATRGR